MKISPEDVKINPLWSKSKEDIWKETFAELDDNPIPAKTRRITVMQYAAAAIMAVLLAGATFAYLYRVTETASRGEHLTVALPDGSKAILNAESKLIYYPYRWFISRSIALEGEACFEVEKGRPFSVLSSGNKVNVLGTTFNVFSRAEKYNVSCIVGKVEVITPHDANLLEAGMQLTCREGKTIIETNTDTGKSVEWIANRFVFSSVPLADVIKEIERQYNIRITTDASLEHSYSGIFEKKEDPREMLEIIGKPFGITFSIEEE